MYNSFYFYIMIIVLQISSIKSLSCENISIENDLNISLEPQTTYCLSENITIKKNIVTIYSPINKTTLIIKGNFSFILLDNAQLSMQNVLISSIQTSFYSQYLFMLNNLSKLFLINATFANFFYENKEFSTIYAINSSVFVEFCLFSNITNMNLSKNSFLLKDNSFLSFKNVLFENLKNKFTIVLENSFLNVSKMIINECEFGANFIETNYVFTMSEVVCNKTNFWGSFVKMNDYFLFLNEPTVFMGDFKFISCANFESNSPLVVKTLGDMNLVLKIKNFEILNNTSTNYFYLSTGSQIDFENMTFNQNYVNFSIFFIESIYTVRFQDVFIQNSNNITDPPGNYINNTWSGSCFILENVLNKFFINISIVNSLTRDSTLGIQFHDKSARLRNIYEKMGTVNDSEDGFIFISKSSFANNYIFYEKDYNTSGILLIDSPSAIQISDCYYDFNVLDSVPDPDKTIGGTCLNALSSKSKIVITHSIFKNNSAKFISNCIFFQGSELTISNCFFISNVPLIGSDIWLQYFSFNKTFVRVLEVLPYGFGGAIHFQGEKLLINGSFLMGNKGYIGGGLLINGGDSQHFLNLTINNTIIEENSAGTMGGGIYLTKDINDLKGSIQNTFFIRNDARYGGGISTDYAFSECYLEIKASFFYRNQAQYCAGLLLHHIRGSLKLIDNKFYENIAFLPKGMTLPILGGAFGLWGSPMTLGFSKNNHFYKNSADMAGGVLGMLNSQLISENDIFENNSALIKGAVFSISSAAILNLSNATISNNKVEGVAVMIAYENSFVYLENIVFYNNSAQKRSGVLEIYLDSSLVAVSLQVYGSNADSAGIFNFYENHDSEIRIYNSSFYFNKANGILIEVLFSFILFENCTFANNTSSLFELENANIHISKSLFIHHECIENNFILGCLFTLTEKSNLLLIQNYFNYIYADFNSAIAYFYESSSIFIENIMTQIISPSFESCTHIDHSNFSVEKSYFEDVFPMFTKIYYSNYSVHGSQFISNHKEVCYNSIFSVIDSFMVIIKNSFFYGNLACSNGSSINLYNSRNFLVSQKSNSLPSEILIANCTFTQHISYLYGGAIYIFDVNTSIFNCSFLQNTGLKGAGIYFESRIEKSSDKLSLFGKNVFAENKAMEAGGAIFWAKTLPDINENENSFYRNNALYGENMASDAIRIFVAIYSKSENNTEVEEFNSKTNSEDFIISNRTPGKIINKTIVFEYVDFYNQTVKTFHETMENIELILQSDYFLYEKTKESFFLQIKSALTYLNINLFEIIEGKLNISNFALYTPPIQNDLFVFMKSARLPYFSQYITSYIPFEANISNYYCLAIPFSTINCQLGEISLANSCFSCKDNKFSLNPLSPVCETCPQHAKCPGGYFLDIDPGYWRNNDSANIYYCDISEQNCGGGFYSECENNYIGPLCRSCPKGFYELKRSVCLVCEDMLIWSIFRIIGVIFLLLLFLAILVKSALENTMLFSKLANENNLASFNEDFLKKHVDTQSIFMKILMNYIQLFTFSRMLPFVIPNFFDNYFDYVSFFATFTTRFIAIECLFQNSTLADFRFLKLTYICVLPFIMLFSSCIMSSLYFKCKKKDLNISDHIFSTMFGVYFMFLPNVIQECMKSLSCIKLDLGKEYLKYEPIFSCDDDYEDKKSSIVWPILISWTLIFPIACFTYLYFQKKSLYEGKIFKKFNFIYIGYKNNYFYWDLVIIVKKFLASLLTIANIGSQTKILILLMIIFLYIYVFVRRKPFLTPLLNSLEYLSCIYLVMGIFINGILNEIDQNNTFVTLILNVLILWVNTMFFFSWGIPFLRMLLFKYKRILKKRFPKIFSCILKLYSHLISKINVKGLKNTFQSFKSAMTMRPSFRARSRFPA